MIINEDDYLEHFGVKGMKWGVRKKLRHLFKMRVVWLKPKSRLVRRSAKLF